MSAKSASYAGPIDVVKWEKMSGEERIELLMARVRDTAERVDSPLFHSPDPLTLKSITPATLSSTTTTTTTNKSSYTVHFLYTIPHIFTNRHGNLHGGAAGIIYDDATTLALAPVSRPGYWMMGGVSRSLGVKFLKPVREGERVEIVCEIISAGRQMAAIRAMMIRASDGAVLNVCEHDKVNSDPPVNAKL